MIRYFSKRAKRDRGFGYEFMAIDIIITFNVYGGPPEALHQIGKYTRNVMGLLRGESNWCRHKIAKPKSREEVLAFFKRVRPRFRFEHEWADLRKDFLHEYYQPQPKEWSQVLPNKVALWASRRLQEITREFSCVDNYRVARAGNTCQERRYRRQQKQGCCGFLDVIDVCPIDGKPYRLGCNYGH